MGTLVDHKAVFDQMPVTRFLLEFRDGDYYLILANKVALEFFGDVSEEIVGERLKDIISEKAYLNLFESLNVCLEKKVTITLPVSPNSIEEMRSLGFWINPVFNDQKEIDYIDVIGQPASADVAVVERERDDALSLLTAIFDAAEVSIIVLDKNRRIIKVNDSFERIYGWSKKDSLGVDFVEFVTSDEKDIAVENYKRFLEEEKRTSGEVKIFCKNGTISNALFTTETLKLSHGRQFQVATLFDFTRYKKMELSLRIAKDQADSANNAKSSFLANMSHELRTPLNAIIGFSEMIKNETFGPLNNDKYLEYITDVYMSASHLLDIINEVLDMSKIEAGKVELDEQEIDLNALSDSLVRVMGAKDLNQNISIKEEYYEDLPKLYADPRLLRQVLINLITNSIKYSLEGGVITVQTHLSAKNEIEITVKDEGVGIPADRIKEALEPFGQTHDPTTHSDLYQGTGLGLPLAKAMVEIHGGVFTLKSVENEGTEVLASFPVSRTRQD